MMPEEANADPVMGTDYELCILYRSRSQGCKPSQESDSMGEADRNAAMRIDAKTKPQGLKRGVLDVD
jgi:hypothetical protein